MNHIEEKAEKAKVTQKKGKTPKDNKSKMTQNDATNNNQVAAAENADKLKEKQLRKLEWEKKLAEQKLNNDTGDGKENVSKAELKAKRREQQEAQRLAKEDKAKPKPSEVKQQSPTPQSPKTPNGKLPEKRKQKPALQKKNVEFKKPNPKCVQLVQHLYKEPPECALRNVNFREIHPAFIKLGVQYAEMVISGSNARCLALLSAIRILTKDLEVPPKEEFCRHMEGVLQSCTDFLQECRPFAVSMTNGLRNFKFYLTHMDKSLSDNDKRAKLTDVVDLYVQNEMKKAWDAISMKVNEKIVNDDVILIYGSSYLIQRILLKAKQSGKKFSVIIVDSRPLLEGKEMLRRLVNAKIKCSYVLINALSFVMKLATKVLLGAHAFLANGSVMSRAGTAQVALVAQTYNKVILICCESYKFTERVQTDSFVHNEIGNPDLLLTVDTLPNASPLLPLKDSPKLNILNLMYDVTPPDLVTMVMTELAVLPCTSVPVVLRINASENI